MQANTIIRRRETRTERKDYISCISTYIGTIVIQNQNDKAGHIQISYQKVCS